jgi:hypothetical protein
MGDHEDAGAALGQEALQEGDAVQVQVVGGLVQEPEVGGGEEEPGQGQAAALAPAQGLHAFGVA